MENMMAVNPWKAPSEIVELLNQIKDKHHPRLQGASIGIAMDDSKLNLGKVTKFSPLARLWQGQQHDFCLSVPMNLWHSVLKGDQRAAYLDLQLARCGVEYLPEEVEENGKKKPVKDEFGRVQYTQQIKVDDEGNPKWKVVPLDLEVFSENVRRYGLWCDDLLELKDAIIAAPGGTNGS
jgi:hypothetical protein